MALINWVQRYWLGLIILAFLLVFISWLIGYYANALLGAKFDLASCWQGLSTIGGAGFIAGVKYLIDSWLNTARTEMPKYEGSESK